MFHFLALLYPFRFFFHYFSVHIFSLASLVAQQCRRHGFSLWVGKIPWRRKWQPTPIFLAGKSHGQRSPTGYSPRGHKRVGDDLVAKQQSSSQLSFKSSYSFSSLLGSTMTSKLLNRIHFSVLMFLEASAVVTQLIPLALP